MRYVIVDDGEITYDNPFGAERTRELESLLRKSGCMIPSFAAADVYSVDTYISSYALRKTQTVFLVDRNIYSDVVSLLRGAPASKDTKVSAALMAFASCVDAYIEPTIALYEGAASGARGGWKRNLSLFRAGDNIHPINWAMVALGYANAFTKLPKRVQDLANSSTLFNPKAKLRAYWFNYPVVLKLAILVRRGGDRNERMVEFLEWMYQCWQFSAPSTILALEVLGKNPPREAFKNIGGSDRIEVLKGIANAAWDMTYLQEWFRRMRSQTEDNRLYVLCSRDILLQRVASRLAKAHLDDETSEQMLRDAAFSGRVVKVYKKLSSTLEDSARTLVPWPKKFTSYRRDLLAGLRDQL